MIDGKLNENLLTSWKEIAGYLGKGVRTVQRWERELALPVRRPARSRHIVVATTRDLDAWIEQLQRSDSTKCCNCHDELVRAQATIQQLREQLSRLGDAGSVAAQAGAQGSSEFQDGRSGKAA